MEGSKKLWLVGASQLAGSAFACEEFIIGQCLSYTGGATTAVRIAALYNYGELVEKVASTQRWLVSLPVKSVGKGSSDFSTNERNS